jgi:tetraacyldisaccharide 4'-kinase
MGYDRGWLSTYDVSKPVISVGNITTGGTGKTPLVAWLCNYLHDRGIRCAILTRGYKTRAGETSDEPALLGKACPGTAVVVNHNRAVGARKALEQHGAQALVLDDGFQHRRQRRDVDIVAVDATCPFGYGRMLPAGLLREPVTGLNRASAVVITRFDQASEEQVSRLVRTIRRHAPTAIIAKAVHKHTHAVTFANRTIPIEELRERQVYAFSGIGNPAAFYNCLAQHGIKVVGIKTFNDHHRYTDSDMKALFWEAAMHGADMLLCTQKDWVKSALLAPDSRPTLAYMAMELEFVEGLEELTAVIDKTIENSKS